MLFWLKKILTVPFLPLYFVLGVGTCGAALLWTRRWGRQGRAGVTVAILALLVFSNKGVALLLLQPLEHRFPPVPEVSERVELPPSLQNVRAIVVLGGGHGDSPGMSRVNQLSSSALGRVAEAVRLSRLLPHAKVIFCGHHVPPPTHAQVLAEAAISLGLEPHRVMLFDRARDTDDEITELKRQMGDARVAVVTSAWHMPRTMQLCAAVGVNAVACPADFGSKPGADQGWDLVAWDLGALERSSRALREYLGMLWLKLRGK